IGAFLILVGQNQVVGAGLQRVDHVLSKSWRGWVVEEVVPKGFLCARTGVIAGSIARFPRVVVEGFWEPPSAIVERPRPVLLNVTPVMVSLLVPFSLKLTVRLLPFSRLTPL